MATSTGNTLGTAGYEQIQAIISGLATYEGRGVSLPDIDRLAVEQDVVAVTSASVALISESMKSQLDRVQGLSILENLFDALLDQGLANGDGADAATPNSILMNALYELMLDNFEQLEGADNEILLNGLLGTLNGLTWYLTDSENWDTADARRAAGDGVWSENNAADSTVIDLAYLDAQAIYHLVETSIGWDALSDNGIVPVSEGSTLDEVIASLEAVANMQSVANFANHFAQAMVQSELIDPNRLNIPGGAEYRYNLGEVYSPDDSPTVFNLDENGNIDFFQIFSISDNFSSAVMAPLWMTTFNPGGQAGMDTYVLTQGQFESDHGSTREELLYLSANGSTDSVTLIESLYFAIEADPTFKDNLLQKYNLPDPDGVSDAPPSTLIDVFNGEVDFPTEFQVPYNTEEYMIQPPRLQAMQAVVEAAFQEMTALSLNTVDLVQIVGGTATIGSVTINDTRPDGWETDLAEATTERTAPLENLSAALDMFKDLQSLSTSLGGMTLARIETQMRSTVEGSPLGLDYGSGTPGSALPFLDELTYRYGSGPDYDAVLADARNDMGSLQNLSVDAFLSNAKLTRDNLSSTTQTLLLDVKNAQANLEGAIELLDSTFEDIKNAMRDLFSNW